MRDERIVITGAAGFIGSHLCERCLADGYRVVGIDNFVTGRLENLQSYVDRDRFELREHDVAEPLTIEGAVDWVYHLASPASPSKYQQHSLACMRANSEGTWRLLELARRHGAGFVLASTSEVYGDPNEHPQPETYAGCVHPIGPRAMYDEAKRFSETLVHEFGNSNGLTVRIARIFNTYGPRMSPDDGRVVSNFACQALRGDPLTVYGDGSQTRSFQYVDDLVEALLRLREVDYQYPVNLGNPDERSIRELADLVLDLVPSAAGIEYHPLPEDDPQQRRPDITLADTLLDWTPRIELEEGLRRTIAHYQSVLGPTESRSESPPRPRA